MSTIENKYLLFGEESARLNFRAAIREDFNSWLKFFEDPNTSKHWIMPEEEPEVTCKKWYKKQFHRYNNNLGGLNALTEKTSGRLIGHCGLLIQTVDQVQEHEVGYSLLPEFWNNGYATEAAKKCLDYAFANELSDSVISIISTTNLPSEKVALKNGMRISKTTEYHGNKVNIFRINKMV